MGAKGSTERQRFGRNLSCVVSEHDVANVQLIVGRNTCRTIGQFDRSDCRNAIAYEVAIKERVHGIIEVFGPNEPYQGQRRSRVRSSVVYFVSNGGGGG